MTRREEVIANYIEAYNRFDIDKMVCDFDINIVFENIQNGETDMRLSGLKEFRQQAEQTKSFFKSRKQIIKSIQHFKNSTEVEIDYNAVLVQDFPNGLKAGQELNLSGKSIFEFKKNKIIKLTDIS